MTLYILNYTLIYYTLLYFTILYFTLLYYTLLYFTILYYTILYFTIQYNTIQYRDCDASHLELRAILDEPVAQRCIGKYAKQLNSLDVFMCWIDIQVRSFDYRVRYLEL